MVTSGTLQLQKATIQMSCWRQHLEDYHHGTMSGCATITIRRGDISEVSIFIHRIYMCYIFFERSLMWIVILPGLTLSDYIKWEEWWYRYQQWLKQERNFERWNRSSGSSHRRRRGNSSQHSAN